MRVLSDVNPIVLLNSSILTLLDLFDLLERLLMFYILVFNSISEVCSNKKKHIASTNKKHIAATNKKHIAATNKKHIASTNKKHIASTNKWN